jgi:TonB-linked SusC/RagA family outer membrane protein
MNKSKVINNMVRKALFILICMGFGAFSLVAQISISGTVTDETGTTVSEVNILVKGSSVGVMTDVNGKYTISVPNGEAVLVFSFIGYAEQEITVGNKTVIDVTLVESVEEFSEVVVIGYGSLEKKQLTSSITSIKAKDLPQGVGGATITNAMKGKVSSLVIQEDASPNSGTTLQLRGMASVNTSRDPLVVIDGMPGGDIRSIVQEDIQSIDILKDAAAGAIYGTRATGGVILITTKKAQEGKMRLSYTGEATFKKNFGKPRYMTGPEYLKYKPNQTNYGSDIDWWDEAMSDNPTSQRHVVTIQGGAPTAKIYASVMYEDNRGVVMNDTRNDLGGRINGNFKVLDGWLDINTHIDYRQAKRNQAKPGIALSNNPTRDPHNPLLWDSQNGLDDVNTIADAALIHDIGVDKWFRPDVELVLNILPVKGLTYHQTVGYENRQWEWQYYAPSTTTVTENQNRTGKGTAELKFDKTELLNSDGYLAFDRKIGTDHYLNAAAGYSYFERNGEMFRLKNYGFAVDGVQMWDIGKGTHLNNASETYKAEMESKKQITQKLFAVFARANYTYKDRYLASATVRREGSSKFAEDNRWGMFWQASAGWRLSQEDFLRDVNWLSDLKVRASYGVTGNEGFDADYAAVMYGSDLYWQLPTGEWAYTYGVTKNINNSLGWEEKHEWNIGIDYELFDGRLFGKIDFYRRDVEGLIYEVDVPSPPNITNKMYKNIGTLENRGWEFEIGGNIVRTKDWNYTTRLNLSHNTTKVGSLADAKTYYQAGYIGRAGDVHRIEQDAQVGSFFLYKYAGLDSEGRFLATDPNGKEINPEKEEVKHLEDKQYIGNYIPTIVAGWSHDLTYKNWSFGMTLTSWIDFDIYNEMEHTQGLVSGTAGGSRNQLLSAYTTNAHIKGQALECDYFLEDGTFLKIQNLSLGYKINTKKYLKLMESARIYFTMNNVLTLTKYSGLTPEVDITGWDHGIGSAGAYPQTRTFALGLQLNF